MRIRPMAGAILTAFFVCIAAHCAPVSRKGTSVRTIGGPVSTQPSAGPKWLWEIVDSWAGAPGSERFTDIDCSTEAGIAVTSLGRLFASRDGGRHWELMVTGLPAPENEDHPEFECCLASGDNLLAGAMKMIVVSQDRGRSWRCASVTGPEEWLRQDWSVYAIAADPINPSCMMAAADIPALVEQGVYRYDEVWEDGELRRIPRLRNMTRRAATTLVMKSVDGGCHWTAEVAPGGLALGRARGLHYERRGRSILIGEHQDRFCAYYEDRRPYKDVWVSTDDGRSWNPAPNPGSFTAAWGGTYAAWITIGGPYMWASSSLARAELWRSSDRGITWREMTRPDNFSGDMALSSSKVGVMCGNRYLYHTMTADASTPRWIRDEVPERCDAERVTVCPDGRYPFLAGVTLPEERLAILGAILAPNQQVKPMQVSPAGPTRSRRAPLPR